MAEVKSNFCHFYLQKVIEPDFDNFFQGWGGVDYDRQDQGQEEDQARGRVAGGKTYLTNDQSHFGHMFGIYQGTSYPW